MFEELGGEGTRDVAARFFRNPNEESFEAFMVTCFPLIGRARRDPDVRARVRLRPEVNFHFFGGELQTYDWFDDLNRIRCPTLILVGDVDELTPPELAKEICSGISGARLAVVPKCGHLSTIERPDSVNTALAEWLGA